MGPEGVQYCKKNQVEEHKKPVLTHRTKAKKNKVWNGSE